MQSYNNITVEIGRKTTFISPGDYERSLFVWTCLQLKLMLMFGYTAIVLRYAKFEQRAYRYGNCSRVLRVYPLWRSLAIDRTIRGPVLSRGDHRSTSVPRFRTIRQYFPASARYYCTCSVVSGVGSDGFSEWPSPFPGNLLSNHRVDARQEIWHSKLWHDAV